MTLTRREWNGLVIAGLAASPFHGLTEQKPNSRIAGVRLGAQTYSFRGMSIDDTVAAMASVGLSYCELWQGQVEPRQTRAELRTWRETVPLDLFRGIRRKFDAAGVT
ncbi:MAG TPA: hypothetical protein VFO19_07150, partial [Vicinamibacterales bacterium]|nr:hypothetical protein [Vicinamibacterales bacterium]